MAESIFADCTDLDISFLDDAYANDAEMAIMLFQQFLEELPGNLALLQHSFRNHDVEAFRKHLHKQKPGFSFVGLTKITQQVHELQTKCQVTLDLATYQKEIEDLLQTIQSSATTIERAISTLEAYK